jgi:hypothetical protein
MKLRPTKQRLLLALWLAGLSISSGYAADPVEALKVCAKMADRDARFACYDELGQRVLEEESAEEQNPLESVVEAAATTTATTATAPTMATEPTDGISILRMDRSGGSRTGAGGDSKNAIIL